MAEATDCFTRRNGATEDELGFFMCTCVVSVPPFLRVNAVTSAPPVTSSGRTP